MSGIGNTSSKSSTNQLGRNLLKQTVYNSSLLSCYYRQPVVIYNTESTCDRNFTGVFGNIFYDITPLKEGGVRLSYLDPLLARTYNDPKTLQQTLVDQGITGTHLVGKSVVYVCEQDPQIPVPASPPGWFYSR